MKIKPVSIDESHEIEIHGLSHQGEGVGRVDNFAVFIKGAIPGEKVLARITEVKKNFAQGELLKVISPSAARIDPPCSWADRCGGCQLQHISYEKQLELKRNIVHDALEKIAGLNIEVLPTLGMECPWRYRNKGNFQVEKVDDKILLGFYEPGSYNFVPGKHSLLFSETVNKVVNYLEELLSKENISVYDRKTGRGYLRNVLIRESKAQGELMIVFVTNDSAWKLAGVADNLIKAFPQVVSVYQNINRQKKAPLFGPQFKHIQGKKVIEDKIGPFIFNISPDSFFQVNNLQTEVLYEKVAEYASLTGEETVIDAYCGIGSIAIFIAGQVKKVYGIEINETAIKDARENARLNKISNSEFMVGKAEEWLPRWVEEGNRADVVIVDPPRKGCAPETLEAIAKAKPKRVVYVSCNPATLARDLKFLAARGFVVGEVQPVDMFPQTSHVECVTLMSRVKD